MPVSERSQTEKRACAHFYKTPKMQTNTERQEGQGSPRRGGASGQLGEETYKAHEETRGAGCVHHLDCVRSDQTVRSQLGRFAVSILPPWEKKNEVEIFCKAKT